MNTTTERLTYLGLLPFIAALIMTFHTISIGDITGTMLFINYSAIILCFVTGALWGQSSHHKNTRHSAALILTNIWALAACMCLLASGIYAQVLAITLLSIGFLHILFLELKIKNVHGTDSYYTMRKRISYMVIACHLIMLLLLVKIID